MIIMEKKSIFSNLIVSIIYALSVLAIYLPLDYLFDEINTSEAYIDLFILILVYIVISYIIHIFVHELGHLIFGLLTGYKFNSFRIGSLILQKKNDKYEFGRLNITGTGGQCLMEAPDTKDWDYPYKLYHLGGGLNNLITGIISLIIYLIMPSKPIFLYVFFVIGLASTILNWLPIRISCMATDGWNVKEMTKSKEARRSVWVQLNSITYTSSGIRMKDLPDEWFDGVDINDDNGVVATHQWMLESRAMDAMDFTKAKELIAQIIDKPSLVSIYKKLLTLDRCTIEVIEKGKEANIEDYYQKDIQTFIRAMQNYPRVIRSRYAIARLYENNEKEAEELLKRFDVISSKHNDEGDINSEKELIEYIKNINLNESFIEL